MCLEISRIRYGPTSKPAQMKKAIEMLLKKWGFDSVTVEGSKIPLRA
jgi:hypothetical protein